MTPDQTPPLHPLQCPHCLAAAPFGIMLSPLTNGRMTIILTCQRCHRDIPFHLAMDNIKIHRSEP